MGVIIKIFAVCPHCGGDSGKQVDHLGIPEGPMPEWDCEECGGWFTVERRSANGYVITKSSKQPWPEHWVLLRSSGPVNLLVKHRRCTEWEATTDEYFFNEHTCPTNYLRDVELVATDDGDTDPHGVFEFIETRPAKPEDDEEIVAKEMLPCPSTNQD